MKEAEIQEIILKEMTSSRPSYNERFRAERAAKVIAETFAKAINKPGPPQHFPDKVCDCGAASVGPNAKHGPMCSLQGGRRR